jgi:hypothetical protein
VQRRVQSEKGACFPFPNVAASGFPDARQAVYPEIRMPSAAASLASLAKSIAYRFLPHAWPMARHVLIGMPGKPAFLETGLAPSFTQISL